MGKLRKGGEDTRGLKAKEQKRAAQAEKDVKRLLAKRAKEDAEWKKGSNVRAASKAQNAVEKRLEKDAAREAKAALLRAEEEALGSIKSK